MYMCMLVINYLMYTLEHNVNISISFFVYIDLNCRSNGNGYMIICLLFMKLF